MWVQRQLDAFEYKINHQLSGGQTTNIVEVKYKFTEIKRIISELNDRSMVLEPVIETMIRIVHLSNIYEISDLVLDTKKKNREKKKRMKAFRMSESGRYNSVR